LTQNKFGHLISRGSAATYLKCCKQRSMGSVANFIHFLAFTNFEDRLRYGQVTAS